MSALYCGCDPECSHLCAEHQRDGVVYRIVPALRCGCTDEHFCLRHQAALVTQVKRDEMLNLFACQALQTLPLDLDLVDRLVAGVGPKHHETSVDGPIVPGSVIAKRIGEAAFLIAEAMIWARRS